MKQLTKNQSQNYTSSSCSSIPEKRTTQSKSEPKNETDIYPKTLSIQMANKHMKRCLTYSLLEKWKSKPRGTSHWSEWLSFKSLQTINAGEGVEKRELSYSVGENANWYSHYGEQCGHSFKNWK